LIPTTLEERRAFWRNPALVVLTLAAIALGALRLATTLPIVNEDGVSYLDLADAWRRADWATAINAYWSPLYAWILAIALKMSGGTVGEELAAVHLANGILFFVAFGAFLLLLREIGPPAAFKESIWLAIGGGLFFWTSLDLITVDDVTPDMCAAALVYAAAWALVRARRSGRMMAAVAVGVVCGLSYLARTMMLPVAMVFVALVGGRERSRTHRVKAAAAASAGLILVATPLIVAISVRLGRPSIGEAGRLNYAWFVNGARKYVHWHGEDPRLGVPAHPTRSIHVEPEIFEFSDSRPVTYPPWFDPAAWHEGITPHFDARQQWEATRLNMHRYVELVEDYPGAIGLCIGLVAIVVVGRHRTKPLDEAVAIAWPAVAALALYSVVYFEYRHVAPFIVLATLGALASVGSVKRAGWVANVASLVIAIGLGATIARSTRGATRRALAPATVSEQQVVADALAEAGVARGAHVARIGTTFGAYWARLAHAQISAELPDAPRFWAAPPDERQRALDALNNTGAAVIVAFHVPGSANAQGWRRIGASPHFLYRR
jgi:hypothetical protein